MHDKVRQISNNDEFLSTNYIVLFFYIQSHFSYPTASSTESNDELISRELQTAAMEKEEILEFECHLAANSSKTPINERNSLLLSQVSCHTCLIFIEVV